MKVALTGASGFIGSYTAATLKRAGHEVRALVRPTSRRDHIQPYVSEFVVGSHNDPDAIQSLVTGVDAVIHNSVDWSARESSPYDDFERNVPGSIRLLEAARLAGAQFIFVSSVAVLHEISDEWNGLITETHPAWPGGSYGACKAAVEAFLKAHHHRYGMNTSAWRPAAVYGIDPRLTRSQWYELIDKARRGETIDTDRGGKITHVQDVADALTYAVGDPSVSGQIYNLVDCYMYWQRAAEFARHITASNATIIDRRGKGPKNQFDTTKAIAFFERHGNHVALRRGENGVREYVMQLLKRMQGEA
ncbi:NAD-dependent epimerase/dehydratase family protein [Fontivita pretiosa]|uniref:NAD-dependent epimerase/dehydratase family protein n=1 Tax=Fontivita pretiosa TaxID=2989684 RepID=UPI003D16EC46